MERFAIAKTGAGLVGRAACPPIVRADRAARATGSGQAAFDFPFCSITGDTIEYVLVGDGAANDAIIVMFPGTSRITSSRSYVPAAWVGIMEESFASFGR